MGMGEQDLSKYRAIPTTVNGIRFASKKEAVRYAELLLAQKAGEIADLKLQPKIPLTFKGYKICTYIGDFLYFDRKFKVMVWEDVKSDMTRKLPVYRIKKKLVKALTGIDITEV